MVLRGHTGERCPNASEIKDLHSVLQDYTNAELKQIPVLLQGSRLEQGAKYIDLKDPERKEFTAKAEAGSDNWYVPKTEVDYQLWNRLTGVQNPERLERPTSPRLLNGFVSVGVEPRFGKQVVLIERAPFVLMKTGARSILARHLTVDTKARVSMKHTRHVCRFVSRVMSVSKTANSQRRRRL